MKHHGLVPEDFVGLYKLLAQIYAEPTASEDQGTACASASKRQKTGSSQSTATRGSSSRSTQHVGGLRSSSSGASSSMDSFPSSAASLQHERAREANIEALTEIEMRYANYCPRHLYFNIWRERGREACDRRGCILFHETPDDFESWAALNLPGCERN